jgi:hypothetical protein
MFVRQLIFAAAASSLVLSGITAHAQDNGALLDLLVRKKIITDQEAEELRGELTRDAAATSAGKLKLSTPITEIELYGDTRLRYEIRTAQAGPPDTITSPGENTQRNRFRYRLRLGLRGTLVDDWFFGLRLETSSNPRSTNVTFGDEASGGPYSKFFNLSSGITRTSSPLRLSCSSSASTIAEYTGIATDDDHPEPRQ